MNDLVQFLSDLTGKAIDIAPQAIEGLVAMKAAYIALWTTVMWWCLAGIGVCLILSMFSDVVLNSDGLGYFFIIVGALCLLLALVGLTEGPLTAPIFNASPEVYVLRDLIN